MSGLNTIAGIVAGYKAGQITEATANRLLRELGADDITALIGGAVAGIAAGIFVGDVVSDTVGDLLDGLF